jgi:hypothetical protein
VLYDDDAQSAGLCTFHHTWLGLSVRISTNQKLIGPTQFQFLCLPDAPKGALQSKDEKQQ